MEGVLSLSLSHSLTLALSLSFSLSFLLQFQTKQTQKIPTDMGKAYSFQANFEKFSQDTTRAKDSKDSKKLNSRLKSPLIICITDYCFFF